MTDNEKMTKILGMIVTMTDRKCLKTIQNTAYNRVDEVAKVKTASWAVGDPVQTLPEYHGRKPYGAIGKIHKINKVKIQVDFNGVIWNMPRALLMKV
ncbi:unnamed protein product [marine sediment metagenome]|uniref:Uncharacterized protein n=1 Tax=marine sediment metagenome TaxID=412755 RepID=X0YTQ6_9ZZZZ